MRVLRCVCGPLCLKLIKVVLRFVASITLGAGQKQQLALSNDRVKVNLIGWTHIT